MKSKLLPLLMVALMLVGCSGRIYENESGLPIVDPGAGQGYAEAVQLCYRLKGEPILVQVEESINVRPNEQLATALVAELAKPRPAYPELIPAVGAHKKAVSVVKDGSITFVTLEREFLENDDKVAIRLAAIAIINTLVKPNDGMQVQLLIERDGAGAGVRPTLAELGFEGDGGRLMEPTGYIDGCMMSPSLMLECALGHIMEGEMESAYALFAQNEPSGVQLPDIAQCEDELRSSARINKFELLGETLSVDGQSAQVTLNAQLSEGGEMRWVDGQIITLQREGVLFKVGYSSLMKFLTGQGE